MCANLSPSMQQRSALEVCELRTEIVDAETHAGKKRNASCHFSPPHYQRGQERQQRDEESERS